MLQPKNIIVDGLDVRYYQSDHLDRKHVLVFLHGWGSEALCFRHILEHCPSAIAIDLPGFGQSQRPSSDWSLGDYSAFVEEFVRKCGLEGVVLIGHSFGGSIAIRAAMDMGHVHRLILIGSAGVRRKRLLRKKLWLVAAKLSGWVLRLPGIRRARSRVRGRFYKAIDSEDYLRTGGLTTIYQNIIREDVQDDMGRIDVPTVLIWGAHDTDTPIEDARLMQRLIRGSELHVLPEAGHYVFLDDEAAFLDIFLRYLL